MKEIASRRSIRIRYRAQHGVVDTHNIETSVCSIIVLWPGRLWRTTVADGVRIKLSGEAGVPILHNERQRSIVNLTRVSGMEEGSRSPV